MLEGGGGGLGLMIPSCQGRECYVEPSQCLAPRIRGRKPGTDNTSDINNINITASKEKREYSVKFSAPFVSLVVFLSTSI